MFDHVKHLKDRTTMVCRVYDNGYCKVLIIDCRNIQSEDGATQILFWKNLKFVMAKNVVPNVTFKGFMVNGALTNWNAVKMIYGDGYPKSIYGYT